METDPPTYNPAVFDIDSVDEAKRIILTASQDQNTDERWKIETPFLINLFSSRLGMGPGKIFVDYGCGIGRLAKEAIEQTGCAILGVDISEDMRRLAPGYVKSASFSAVSRHVFEKLVHGGFRAHGAFSVWVLQHCLNPTEDIRLIESALNQRSRIGIVNMNWRAIPTDRGWKNDGRNIRETLSTTFSELETGVLPENIVGKATSEATYWGIYSRN